MVLRPRFLAASSAQLDDSFSDLTDFLSPGLAAPAPVPGAAAVAPGAPAFLWMVPLMPAPSAGLGSSFFGATSTFFGAFIIARILAASSSAALRRRARSSCFCFSSAAASTALTTRSAGLAASGAGGGGATTSGAGAGAGAATTSGASGAGAALAARLAAAALLIAAASAAAAAAASPPAPPIAGAPHSRSVASTHINLPSSGTNAAQNTCSVGSVIMSYICGSMGSPLYTALVMCTKQKPAGMPAARSKATCRFALLVHMPSRLRSVSLARSSSGWKT
mmetsp:Transcript_35270/g.98567  ORF Transcript_35270/g.98567 Transcript_35270/m.98567 type:complete len:279 (+) Transcript_35270:1399-2235(+)